MDSTPKLQGMIFHQAPEHAVRQSWFFPFLAHMYGYDPDAQHTSLGAEEHLDLVSAGHIEEVVVLPVDKAL